MNEERNEKNFYLSVGRKIREVRRRKGISLKELARKLNRTYQQIQYYETGNSRISLPKLIQVAEILNISPLELLPEEIREKFVPEECKQIVGVLERLSDEEREKLKIFLAEFLNGFGGEK